MKKIRFHPLRSLVNKLTSIKADPVKICYGFAFGVFMSTTPFIGIKWVLALPFVIMFKWSKMACLAGIMQVNYLTGPLFYAASYFVGKAVCGFSNCFQLPERMNLAALKMMLFSNSDVFISLLVGGFILGIPLTFGAYYLTRTIISRKLNTQFS